MSHNYRYQTRSKRNIELAHHQRYAHGLPSFYPRYINLDPFQPGLKLLQGPRGCPVVRMHGDLKPGEVSWVLE